jgi:hypothetical protein
MISASAFFIKREKNIGVNNSLPCAARQRAVQPAVQPAAFAAEEMQSFDMK